MGKTTTFLSKKIIEEEIFSTRIFRILVSFTKPNENLELLASESLGCLLWQQILSSRKRWKPEQLEEGN
jgi:hypothetical protein